ncbi:hypothetical protein GFS60_07849 (plasmid) [Rhodococcus sp. WAY2]|nr:hypothetical protein GFS60_07849 [Rhodococcus sp. WAY2]
MLGCGSGPIQRRTDLIVLSALGDGVPLGVDTVGQEIVWSRELFLLVPLREASFAQLRNGLGLACAAAYSTMPVFAAPGESGNPPWPRRRS